MKQSVTDVALQNLRGDKRHLLHCCALSEMALSLYNCSHVTFQYSQIHACLAGFFIVQQ